MGDWKDIGSNIIKLEGFGLYATHIDDQLYVCPMQGATGHPKLDRDKCIDWEELKDPPNQEFLNLLNRRFDLKVNMNDFGGMLSIREVKEYVRVQKEIKDGKDSGVPEESS